MKTINCPWCSVPSPLDEWKNNTEHLYHICMPMSHTSVCPKCGYRTVFGPMASIEDMEKYKPYVKAAD